MVGTGFTATSPTNPINVSHDGLQLTICTIMRCRIVKDKLKETSSFFTEAKFRSVNHAFSLQLVSSLD